MSKNRKAERDRKRKKRQRRLKKKREEVKRSRIESEKALKAAWPKIQEQIIEHQKKQAAHKKIYGDVKEQITADFQGYKLVAIGNTIHYKNSWKTFPDFLQDYILACME